LGPGRTAYCHDAETGEILWQQRLPGEFRDEFFASSFAVSGDVALVACGPLFALDTADGQIRWASQERADYNSHSSPVVWQAGQTAIAICNTAGGRTKAFQLSDGKQLWELNSGVGQSSPIVAGNVLLTYGSSRKRGLTAFEMFADSPAKQPQQLWQFRGAADSGSTPVLRDDAVFVQGDKRVAKVNLADGKTVWQTTLRISNPRYTSLIAAGNQVFYGWEGLLALDAEADKFRLLYDAEIDSEGRLIGGQDLRKKLGLDKLESGESEKLWQQKAIKTGPLACSTPAFSDGRIVIRLRNALTCYDLRKP
jgi:outer membrane protein assembly factor BamB